MEKWNPLNGKGQSNSKTLIIMSLMQDLSVCNAANNDNLNGKLMKLSTSTSTYANTLKRTTPLMMSSCGDDIITHSKCMEFIYISIVQRLHSIISITSFPRMVSILSLAKIEIRLNFESTHRAMDD